MPKDFHHLLQSVRERINHQRTVRRLRGEDFNVFRVLGLSRDEERLHTRLITHLLDPSAKHGMGAVFLQLFISSLDPIPSGMDLIRIESASDYRVRRERFIGRVDKRAGVGGRLDICILDRSDEPVLVIENKIDAQEQPGWVQRYTRFARGAPVVFLTLDGRKPSKDGDSVVCMSYADHIIPWLENCLKEVHDRPGLRETIRQYLHLVQQITHRMDTTNRKQGLLSILDDLEAAEHVKRLVDEIPKIREDFRKRVREAVERLLSDADASDELSRFHVQSGSDTEFYVAVADKPLKLSFWGFTGAGPLCTALMVRQDHRKESRWSEYKDGSCIDAVSSDRFLRVELMRENDRQIHFGEPEWLRWLLSSSDEQVIDQAKVELVAEKMLAGAREILGDLEEGRKAHLC